MMKKKILTSSAVLSLLALPAIAGDPAPGVDVLLEQIPGGVVYTGKTDGNGNIIFGSLPPGQYRVFQEIEKPAITVNGPATFTPSNGDDIGTLTITGKAPITINKITARSQHRNGSDRVTARVLDASRINRAIAAPVNAEAAMKMMQTGQMKTATGAMKMAPASTDEKADPLPESPKPESLNSSRSNNKK